MDELIRINFDSRTTLLAQEWENFMLLWKSTLSMYCITVRQAVRASNATNEDEIEVQTETLALTTPLTNGYVKQKQTIITDAFIQAEARQYISQQQKKYRLLEPAVQSLAKASTTAKPQLQRRSNL